MSKKLLCPSKTLKSEINILSVQLHIHVVPKHNSTTNWNTGTNKAYNPFFSLIDLGP